MESTDSVVGNQLKVFQSKIPSTTCNLTLIKRKSEYTMVTDVGCQFGCNVTLVEFKHLQH